MLNSRSGSYYASTAKLLNCLVGCLLMATMAFAAIPYFLVTQSKATVATHPNDSHLNRARVISAWTDAHPVMFYGSKPSLHRASRIRGKGLMADYAQVIQVQDMTLKSPSTTPEEFEIHEKTENKRSKPDAM